MDQSLRALQDGEQAAARDRWDPDYVAERLGRDPQRLFEWVRDRTYWVPYRGVLRGPVGVLMDREGNSLDRAVLLATLLEKAGQTVRLAHGDLSRSQALMLLPRLRSPPGSIPLSSQAKETGPATPPADPDTGHAQLRSAAASYGLSANGVEQTLTSQEHNLATVSAELDARVTEQSARLLQGIVRPKAEATWGTNLDAAIAALRDHWWVQWQNGSRWLDLDALLPIGAADAPLAAARETLSLTELERADVHQEIAVRVIAEQWSPRGLKERTVLEHVLRPAALIGQPIVLQSLPMNWLADDSTASPAQADAGARRDWHAELLDQHAWWVALSVGSGVVAEGQLSDSGSDPEVPPKGGAMGGFASAFSATMNHDSGSPGAHGSGKALSAVWLEYEFRAPGIAPRIVRRTVFDLLGPAARSGTAAATLTLDDGRRLTRGLALSMQTQLLPQVCQLAPGFMLHLMAQSLLGNRDLLMLGNTGAASDRDVLKHAVAQVPGPALSPLYTLALARMRWSHHAAQLFLGSPDLLTSHTYLVAQGKSGLAIESATDIVSNDIGVLLSADDPFRVRLEQGVVDTNAESLVRLSQAVSGNAGDAFKRGGRWVTVTNDPADPGLGRLKLSADARSRIAAEAAQGEVAVAPESPVATGLQAFEGWWRIDPESGTTLGFGANGWGQELEEEESVNVAERTVGQRFKEKLFLFSRVFTTTYGFCLFAMEAGTTEKEGLHFGSFYATLVESHNECTADAAVIGFVSVLGSLTLPLIAIEVSEEAGNLGRGTASETTPLPKTPRSPKATSVPNMRAATNEPSNPGESAPPDQCEEGATGSGGATGEGGGSGSAGGPQQGLPYDPSSLDAQYEQAIDDAATAEKQLGPRATDIDTAQQAYDAAKQAHDQAHDVRYKLFAGHAPAEQVQQALDLETQALNNMNAARMKLGDARIAYHQVHEEIQGDYNRANYAKSLKAPNAKALEALKNQQAALQQFDVAFCEGSGFRGPAYDNWQAANRAYANALQQLRDAEWGGSPAAGPGGGADPTMIDPNAATQAGNAATGGALQPVAINPNNATPPGPAGAVDANGATLPGNAGSNGSPPRVVVSPNPGAPPSALDKTMAGTAGVMNTLGVP